MLSIGLSVNSGIKLLERTLKFRTLGVNKMMQDVLHSFTPTAEVAKAKVVTEVATVPKTLKVAKTTMPDQRLDFNQTFLHIRHELDGYYKDRNPIFSNTIAPEQLQRTNVSSR